MMSVPTYQESLAVCRQQWPQVWLPVAGSPSNVSKEANLWFVASERGV